MEELPTTKEVGTSKDGGAGEGSLLSPNDLKTAVGVLWMGSNEDWTPR